ncbi:hypothetical protein BB561_004489 [Smittium simulii]|uniref:ubiquitinyl hydrolase 1 n=1 Tax=Smittium simulii TaxID=133385 RepID=A0A2T9YG08_9FUNG|nr:hypothetical protein BB561_004489 [Smittium simulii]
MSIISDNSTGDFFNNEISLQDFSKFFSQQDYGDSHNLIILDVRPSQAFSKCHIKFKSIININPEWITNSSVFNYLLYKLGTTSKDQQDLFLKIGSTKNIVYLDDRNYRKDHLTDITIYESKYQIMFSIFNKNNNLDFQNFNPISFKLFNGNVHYMVDNSNNSLLTGSDIEYYTFSPLKVITASNETNIINDSNSSGDATKNIPFNNLLSPSSPRKDAIKKRSGAIIPQNVANILAQTVKTSDSTDNISDGTHDIFQIYNNLDKVKTQNEYSKTNTHMDDLSQKPLLDNQVLHNKDNSSIYQNADVNLASTNINLNNEIENDINPPNSDLYFVIGRKSESIKNALKSDSLKDESRPVDRILRRKTIFDDFLLGFTNKKTSQANIDNPEIDHDLKEKKSSDVFLNQIDSLQSHNTTYTNSLDYNNSNLHHLVNKNPSLIVPPKPIELIQDQMNFNNNEVDLAKVQSSTPSLYSKPLPQKPFGSKLIPPKHDFVYRSSSSGPQSNMLEMNVNAPPTPPRFAKPEATYSKNRTMIKNGNLTIPNSELELIDPVSSFTSKNLLSHQKLSSIPQRSIANITLTGLKNFGNTCYINAVIQCLYGTLPLSRFFLTGLWKRDAGVNRKIMGFSVKKTGPKSFSLIPLNSESAKNLSFQQKLENLTAEFSNVIDQLASDQFTVLSPQVFLHSVKSCIPIFSDNNQHDAQEFASYLLSNIHECLNIADGRLTKQKSAKNLIEIDKEKQKLAEFEESKRFEAMPDFYQSELKWKEYTNLNQSVISSIFQGQLQSRLVCANCGHKSTTYSTFSELSVPIPLPGDRSDGNSSESINDKFKLSKTRIISKLNKKASIKNYHNNFSNLTVNLSECISKFVEPEILDINNEWFCSNCKRKSSASKTLKISKLPLVLMIHLKRFSYEGPFRDKIDAMVNYPVSNLDMSPFLAFSAPESNLKNLQSNNIKNFNNSTSVNPNSYHLYSVVNHMGSLTGGHYTASVYNGHRNEWNYFNDTRVLPISESEIVSPAAYLLFYVRSHS